MNIGKITTSSLGVNVLGIIVDNLFGESENKDVEYKDSELYYKRELVPTLKFIFKGLNIVTILKPYDNAMLMEDFKKAILKDDTVDLVLYSLPDEEKTTIFGGSNKKGSDYTRICFKIGLPSGGSERKFYFLDYDKTNPSLYKILNALSGCYDKV